jgi:hypothetical protein
MSLETKSKELKDLVATYDTQWLLGDLSFVMYAGRERASDQLGQLSSPMRQLYYLAGLNVSSDPAMGTAVGYDPEKWQQIVLLLNEIEGEYQQLFFPTSPEEMTEEWRHVRKVAMPSFLSYFNQGPLNYEEQVINWIRDLFTPLNHTIQSETGLQTEDFIQFYENLDRLRQNNFQAHSTKPELLRPNWKDYTKIKMGIRDEAPDFIKEMGKQNEYVHYSMADHGMMDRFYPEELVSENLPIEKVKPILALLTTSRSETDFLYYTATKPGNPVYEKPIIDIGGGMFQVFEVKQVIYAVKNFLEKLCSTAKSSSTKYVDVKGNLLENRILELFKKFFKKDFKYFQGYYVDGNEQDILFLWKEYAFIIEAKGYALREPLRDPDKAFVRIKKDFDACIGYGYTQTRRVEKKFIEEIPLTITDKNGKVLEVIDTTKYKEDFSIIVNLETFGQIQTDLSTLIQLEGEDDLYPWAVKLDDLEIFLLTMLAKGKKPMDFIRFLLLREMLHGKLFCSDELEVCGAYLSGTITQKMAAQQDQVQTTPMMGDVFDKQYYKGMGLKNEKLLYEKQSDKYLFW